MERLTPGLTGEVETTVADDDTAARQGSGLVPVFGTPALVALMENAAVRALEGDLPPGQTSVGGRMDVRHLAPTPVGMRVRARAELLEMEGRRLVFHVEAWDELEQIGRATHERFIVDQAAFVAKAKAKAE
ncbi:MAG: thioesterase family protein [Anaerolineae bacterium]|jgi:predicted thioesterase